MYLKTKYDIIQACWENEIHVTKGTHVNHIYIKNKTCALSTHNNSKQPKQYFITIRYMYDNVKV